jgi:hypothetical protein
METLRFRARPARYGQEREGSRGVIRGKGEVVNPWRGRTPREVRPCPGTNSPEGRVTSQTWARTPESRVRRAGSRRSVAVAGRAANSRGALRGPAGGVPPARTRRCLRARSRGCASVSDLPPACRRRHAMARWGVSPGGPEGSSSRDPGPAYAAVSRRSGTGNGAWVRPGAGSDVEVGAPTASIPALGPVFLAKAVPLARSRSTFRRRTCSAARRSGRCGQQADMPAGCRSARNPFRVAGNHPIHASVRALPALRADDRAPGRGVPLRGSVLRSRPARPGPPDRGLPRGRTEPAAIDPTRAFGWRGACAWVLWPIRSEASWPPFPGASALEGGVSESDSVASEHPCGARCARWRGGGGSAEARPCRPAAGDRGVFGHRGPLAACRDTRWKEGKASRKVSSSSSGKTSEGGNPMDAARTNTPRQACAVRRHHRSSARADPLGGRSRR